MRTPSQWLAEIRSHELDAGDGYWLEDMVCELGSRVPEWDLKTVWKWSDWPDRYKHFPALDSSDIGIDCVGARRDGSLVAIQCKARGSNNPNVRLGDVATFLNATTSEIWAERWIVTNGNLSKNLRSSIATSTKPVKQVDFLSPVARLSSPVREDDALTAMQNQAVERIVTLLPEHAKEGRPEWNEGEARGYIVMPCGTGKTRVSYRVLKELLSPGEIGVILVPSIALVSQLKREIQALAYRDDVEIQTLAVCSDVTAGRNLYNEDSHIDLRDPTIDVGVVSTSEVVGDTAIDESEVVRWLVSQEESNSVLLLFCTYQSAHNTAGALKHLGKSAKLMIGDEAHRTAGIRKSPSKKTGERIRNFTICHDSSEFPAIYRLYQTATPRIYDGSKVAKLSDRTQWEVRSMDDESIFGPELFRLSYLEAVEKNLLTDYRIVAWAMGSETADVAEKLANELNRDIEDNSDLRWTTARALRALTLAAFLAGGVPGRKVNSVIAFCNRIQVSRELAAALNTDTVREWIETVFSDEVTDLSDYEIDHVDASHSSSIRNLKLEKLHKAAETGPYCISNVGIFGEGTDSPDLSAVAFMQPRKSPVDVVQAVGRAMRKSPHKELGYILVPVVVPPNTDVETFLRYSSPKDGWQELGQILQALRAHDGRIEDYLSDLMEIYAPAVDEVEKKYVLVVRESGKEKVLSVTTKKNIESSITPSENDNRKWRDKLAKLGTVQEVTDVSDCSILDRPAAVFAIRIGKGRKVYSGARIPESDPEDPMGWNPSNEIDSAKQMIRDHLIGKPDSGLIELRRPSKPKPDKKDDENGNGQIEKETWETLLGKKLVQLAGSNLEESGVTLNLLERSGIQSGPKRDFNLIRESVESVAMLLRDEGVEFTLAKALDLKTDPVAGGEYADACTTTAIIWMNAAIMHARLDMSESSLLGSVPKLREAVSSPRPARNIGLAWNKILIKDYVPIFEVARDLLIEIGYDNRSGVSSALRRVAKDAVDLGETYASLGTDFAGQLFNEVIGNQKSDGAFFTRPISATMLAELSLRALGEMDWTQKDSWKYVSCFDPACGSGTMLAAMLDSVKTRIQEHGGNRLAQEYHQAAVENLLVGADVNPVSLQLAASQITVGNIEASYRQMNIFRMEYGQKRSNHQHGIPSPDNARAGTIELLLSPELYPQRSELELENLDKISERLQLSSSIRAMDEISEQLTAQPPRIVIMNPPYTNWSSVGSKFDVQLQKALRERIGEIWEHVGMSEPLLQGGRKSSVAPLFEAIAVGLVEKNSGVLATVRPATLATMPDARVFRKLLAKRIHIDFILVCHEPRNVNMSWDTSLKEMLLVGSSGQTNLPTKFIHLDRFPSDPPEARRIVNAALEGQEFEGEVIEWNYERVLSGDWSPIAFKHGRLAELTAEVVAHLEESCSFRTPAARLSSSPPLLWGGISTSQQVRHLMKAPAFESTSRVATGA